MGLFRFAGPVGVLVVSLTAALAEQPDPNAYYNLSTKWRGTDVLLDVINGGPKDNLTHFIPRAGTSGQLWRFTPTGGGYGKLTTKFKGPDGCLDVNNGGLRDNQPYMRSCADLTGQLWKLEGEGAFVRLKTKFRGDGVCLDVINGGPDDGQPQLRPCGNFSGQLWRFTRAQNAPVGLIADNQAFSLPRHRDVRLDFCWSWTVKDCGQRVADWWCRKRLFKGAADFKPGKADGHTAFIGSNESCNDAGCSGFETITCRGHLGHDSVFANPSSGAPQRRLDVCLEFASKCGAPIAEAFCKARGFQRWIYFEADEPGAANKTLTFGSRQPCDGANCRAMNVITCDN